MKALEKVKHEMNSLFEKQEYSKCLECLATLQRPIDFFFEDVLVMDSDQQLRHNRIAILSHVQVLFSLGADFAELRVERA